MDGIVTVTPVPVGPMVGTSGTNDATFTTWTESWAEPWSQGASSQGYVLGSSFMWMTMPARSVWDELVDAARSLARALSVEAGRE